MDRILENKIIDNMKQYFENDKKYIDHALKVLSYTKELLKQEKGDSQIVFTTAILHDIGIKLCKKKYNSTGGQLQEIEGPPIARKILKELEIDSKIIDEVCDIIASHHSPGEINTLNFKIIWDADWLVNLGDEYNIKNKEKLEKVINKIFLTKTGKNLGKSIYLNQS
jgi:HD superfamily phosphodiesterase